MSKISFSVFNKRCKFFSFIGSLGVVDVDNLKREVEYNVTLF